MKMDKRRKFEITCNFITAGLFFINSILTESKLMWMAFFVMLFCGFYNLVRK